VPSAVEGARENRGDLDVAHVPVAAIAIGLQAAITSIDPNYHNLSPNNSLLLHIYELLVMRDANQKLVPGLATSWRALDDVSSRGTARTCRSVARFPRRSHRPRAAISIPAVRGRSTAAAPKSPGCATSPPDANRPAI
jgi:hypothetical protein